MTLVPCEPGLPQVGQWSPQHSKVRVDAAQGGSESLFRKRPPAKAVVGPGLHIWRAAICSDLSVWSEPGATRGFCGLPLPT